MTIIEKQYFETRAAPTPVPIINAIGRDRVSPALDSSINLLNVYLKASTYGNKSPN